MKQSDIKVGGEYLQRQGSSYGAPRKVQVIAKGLEDSYGKKTRVQIKFLDEPARWDRTPKGAVMIVSSGQIRSTWADWEKVLEQRAIRDQADKERRAKDDRRTSEIHELLRIVGIPATDVRVSNGVPKIVFEGDKAGVLLGALSVWGEEVKS